MTTSPEQIADALREHIRLGPGESLYGVVDGAQDLELAYEAKCLYGQEIHNLFEGNVGPALADVAPYVVPIDPDSGYLENWARRWGKNAGIFLTTSTDTDTLHGHLRRCFIVRDTKGQEYFLRFYDPRVLRQYLSICNHGRAQRFFGPIERILAEADTPETLLSCKFSGKAPVIDKVPLA